MDEILKLQPGELWVWLYLCGLAKRQDSLKVTLPYMRLNRTLQQVYSPRQFLRHLLSLETKKFLLIITREKNWRGRTVVAIASKFYLDMGVQLPGHESLSSGGNGGADRPTWPSTSKKEPGSNDDGHKAQRIYPVSCVQVGHSASASAKVIKSLEALMQIEDQERLLKEVAHAVNKEELEMQLAKIAPMAKGKKISQTSRIYAAIRFIQSGQGKERPAAWVEEIAKRTERMIRRGVLWGADSSGSAGRSQFPGTSGRRANSS